MAWDAWPGVGADSLRQLLGGSSAASSGNGATGEEHCTCLPAEHLGTEVEHTIVLSCLWVAFALSVIILVYYMWCTYKEHCGWEEVYVVTIEMLKTIMEIFYETYSPATLVLFNGVHISWLRYAEWLLTCPVILIHLSNLTGLGQYNKRTMRLLVSDIGTIVCGVTAALCKPGPMKIVFFMFGMCYGASTFLTAASVYVSAYKEVPAGECKLFVKLCAWVFFGSWLLFPVLFLMGPEGFGHLSVWGSIIAHTFIDLLSKNLWGLLAHHLRNKVQEHMAENGGLVVASEQDDQKQQAEEQLMSEKLRRSSAPGTPRAAGMTGRFVDEGDVVARITAGQPGTNPSKALATLSRKSSGIWNPTFVEPVRVLLGLPAENADTVLEQFQEQFAALPVAAEALPATGVAALLAAAANASAFGGADAVLLHISYLRAGAPGVASGADLLGTLQEIGIRVYVYGCDMGGIPDDMSELASSLDGVVEGPTWATPLNNRQLAALLLLLHATRNGSRPPSVQGYSRPLSPSSIPLRTNSMGPILRSPSGMTLAATMTGITGNRRSLDLTHGLSPVRTATMPVPAATASTAPPPPNAAATGAGQPTFDDAEILQQLMAEIASLKKELSKEV